MTKRVLIIQGHPDPTRKHFLIGLVESRGTEYRGRWLSAMERLGGSMS